MTPPTPRKKPHELIEELHEIHGMIQDAAVDVAGYPEWPEGIAAYLDVAGFALHQVLELVCDSGEDHRQ